MTCEQLLFLLLFLVAAEQPGIEEPNSIQMNAAARLRTRNEYFYVVDQLKVLLLCFLLFSHFRNSLFPATKLVFLILVMNSPSNYFSLKLFPSHP